MISLGSEMVPHRAFCNFPGFCKFSGYLSKIFSYWTLDYWKNNRSVACQLKITKSCRRKFLKAETGAHHISKAEERQE